MSSGLLLLLTTFVASAWRCGFVPLERLAVSPQCGFASGEISKVMTLEEQDAKLRLIGDVARRVWG